MEKRDDTITHITEESCPEVTSDVSSATTDELLSDESTTYQENGVSSPEVRDCDTHESSQNEASQNEANDASLPVTRIDLNALASQLSPDDDTISPKACSVERDETPVEKLARAVAKNQLIPGSLSLRDTSLKGPGICMFKYLSGTDSRQNFGYFFIKKGSELWNEYERSYPRISELYNIRRNQHDLVCIGVTIDSRKPLTEEVVFSYYSYHTHELLLMI